MGSGSGSPQDRPLDLRLGPLASSHSAHLSSRLRSQNANFQNPRCENTPLIGRESPPPSVSLRTEGRWGHCGLGGGAAWVVGYGPHGQGRPVDYCELQ